MKRLLLLPLLLATIFTANAQGDLKFGIKGGATFSSFSNGQPHTGSKSGFTLGAYGHYPFSDLLGILVEASYFQQGGSFVRFKDETRFGADQDFFTKNVTSSQITFHNIEVPVLLRVSIPTSSDLKPLFFAGPSVGINVKASEKYERTGELDNGVYVTASGNRSVTSQYSMYQFGANAGLGVEMPLGDHTLSVDARYRYGINSVKKAYSYIDFYGVSEKLYTNSLVFTVGFGF